MVRLICLLLCCSLTLAPLAHAKGDSRSNKIFGVHMGFNGGISPGLLGGGVGVNLGSLARFNLGVSGANDLTTNGPIRVYNATFAPLFSIVFSLISYIVTIGLVPWNKHREFWDLTVPTTTPKHFFAYGSQVQIFVPNMDFSPFISVGYARYTSDGSYGLDNDGAHVYYGAGLDWTSPGGFNLGFAWNYSPRLPTSLVHALYGYVGFYF